MRFSLTAAWDAAVTGILGGFVGAALVAHKPETAVVEGAIAAWWILHAAGFPEGVVPPKSSDQKPGGPG